MKSGLTLELPVVYDTYSYAHDIQDFYDRVWSPSLALLGLVPPLSQLKIDPKSKFTAKLDPAAVADFFHMAGLNNIADMAVTLSKNRNFAQWYREGALLLAAKVNQLLHLNISVEVVPTEVLIDNSFIGDMPFDQLSVILKESAGHEVVLGNLPDGTQVKTDNLQALPYESIAQLHKQGGWLGGAAIYKAIYSLGMYGPIVVMVKDSQAGLVQRLVNPFLRRDFHTYLLPVGLTRMSAFGQDPDASIDMWVFLELLARWGETASHKLAQIWDALEVPLIRDHVGIKTLIEVTVNGVNISRVTDY
jgi:hypothetical protein